MEPLPVDVPVGPCRCPDTPHPDGDIVYLAPELSMRGGMAAQGAIAKSGTDPIALQEDLGTVWIRHAVVDWTFVDEDGDKIPLTEANIIRLLPYSKGGRAIAERADDLYKDDVLAPLAERLRSISQRGRTATSTSPTRASRTKRRSPSSSATTARARRAG